MTETVKARTPILARLIAVFVFCLGLNALKQAPQFLERWGGDPPLLSFEQLLVGIAGVTAGYLAWRVHRSAWIAVLVWGTLSAILVGTLGPMLALDPEAWRGLYFGAASVAAITVVFAWLLRRAARTDR